MKKVKILIMILMTLVLTLLLTIMVNNVSYAANYSGLGGVDAVLAADPKSVLNQTISLSFSDLKASDKLYCMERGQRNQSMPYEYKICQYIEINGTEVTGLHYGVGGNYAEHSNSTRANAVLAEVLAYGQKHGYGPGVDQYTEAQRGFYVYFPEWIQYSGIEGGLGIDHSWDAGSSYTDNGVGAAVVSAAKTNVYDKGSRKSARIFLLDCTQTTEWQRLMIAVTSDSIEEEEPEPQNPSYDGYIKIRGKVWVDGESGKANKINGTYGDSGEQALGGITVKLLDSGGSEFTGGSRAVTKSDGTYEIVVNRDPTYNVYKLWEKPDIVHEKLMGAYVEFEYNGYSYTTVAPYTDGVKTSKAVEDYGSRSSYDNKYTMVTPSSGTPGGHVTASTKSIINFRTYAYKTTEKVSETTLFCNADGSPKTSTSQSSSSKGTYLKTNDNEWEKPITLYNQSMHHRDHYVDDTTKPIYVRDKIGEDEETGEPIYGKPYWNGKYEQKFSWREFCPNYSGGHGIGSTRVTNLIVNNVNLGLFKREQPDIALTSDIDKVDVTMNNQQYTYKYGHRGDPSYDDKVFGTQVKFQNKYTYTYRKPVNPADVAYVADGDKTDVLKVQVTYKITLSNQSTTLPVKVHKLMNYYDSEYTITSNTVESTENKGKFKKSVVILNNAVSIQPGKTEQTYITYNISFNAIKQLIKQDSTLNNAFEIHTYSTQYGSNTLCAEQMSGSGAGRTGKNYAGRDVDSQPGNAPIYYESSKGRLSIKNQSDYQDDTDIAPAFVLVLDRYKVMAGTVYEDTQTEASRKENERLGNGIKDANEKGIANVKVELIRLNDKGEDQGLAKMYIVDRTSGNWTAVDAVTYTDANGNFWFGKEGSVEDANSKGGVVVDNYLVRYTYGNNIIKSDGTKIASTLNGTAINARNFKSTIVTQEPIKGIVSGTNNTKKWHLEINKSTNANTAVDDLNLRATTTDNVPLTYANFNDGVNMIANSIPVSIQVEYTPEQHANVDINGKGGFTYTWDTFDFGLIERPREDLIMDKTITKLKITLANGQVLIEGDPRNEKLDYTKALGVKVPIDSRGEAVPGRDKLISIEMDSEYIQGATLEIWYAITATNNSEKDYEYSVANPKYYFYGDKEGLPLLKTSVESVVDYLDPELVVDLEHVLDAEGNIKNGDYWKLIDAKDLYDQGLISQKTYNVLKEKEYIALITDEFAKQDISTGKSYTVDLYASKLLANKEEALSFENHSEIVKINGKTARTIDSVQNDDRTQITKTYKPGDYIPNADRKYDSAQNREEIASIAEMMDRDAGLHEQDDDMVRIVITPPTGISSEVIIYIITVAVALITIGVGVYMIKKKVL